MKRVLFLGATDKTDMMFYMAKLMCKHKRVVIIDVTESQRYRYAYPKLESMQNDTQPVRQEYDGFDVIENISNYRDLDEFIKLDEDEYDIALIDCDHVQALQYWPNSDFYFLVTSYENPVIKRNEQIISCMFKEKPAADLIPMHKFIIDAGSNLTEDIIHENLIRYPIDWKDTFTTYPDETDSMLKVYNQYESKIRIKGLSRPYRSALSQIVGMITDTSPATMKKIWKLTERV